MWYLNRVLSRISSVIFSMPARLSLSVLIMLARISSLAISPLLLLKGLDEMGDDENEFSALVPWFIGYAILLTFSEMLPYFQEKLLASPSLQLSFNLTHEVMETYYASPMEARTSNTNAPAVQHFGSSYEHLGTTFITELIGKAAPYLLEALVMFSLIISEHTFLGLAFLANIFVYFIFAIIGARYIGISQNQYVGSLFEGYELIITQLDQYENAHYYGNVETEIERSDGAMRRLGEDFNHSLSSRAKTSSFLTFSFGAGLLGTLIYAVSLFSQKVLSLDKLIILTLYLLQTGSSLRSFSESTNKIVGNYENFKMLLDYVDEEHPAAYEGRMDTVISRAESSIIFDKVCFGYDSEKNSLSDVSFSCEPGTVTAIVGRSGAGKSTLTRLLMGFYLPSSGKIYLGKHALSDFSSSALRNNFAVVPQSPAIFPGTILDNIKYGNLDASDDKLIAAARNAGLSDFVDSDRLDDAAGSGGRKLSGGQKQRIAIARAYLRETAPYLVLDEPTASLDPKTEAEVLEHLRDLVHSRGSTVIIVTHDLETLTRHIKVDQVVNLDDFFLRKERGITGVTSAARSPHGYFSHASSSSAYSSSSSSCAKLESDGAGRKKSGDLDEGGCVSGRDVYEEADSVAVTIHTPLLTAGKGRERK